MTNEQQRSPIFCLDELKKHLYNTIWGIKPLLMREHSKHQLLIKIQNKKLLQMMEFSNILIIEVKSEGLLGYTMGLLLS
jgi:hypothetical protein